MGRSDADVFTESLLEFSARSRRGWTTLLSFAVQIAAVAALVLLPLFYTQALPAMLNFGPLIGPPPGAPPRAASGERRAARRPESELVGDTVRQPIRIRKGVAIVHDLGALDQVPDNELTILGGTGSSESGKQIMSLLAVPPKPAAPAPPVPTRGVLVSSSVLQGLLIRQVRPVYPRLAIITRVQGAVVLDALISRAGTIENLRVVSGHPLLVRAAVEAVQQWRYRPYLLNGEPVEVETQITVNFTLGGGA
jgi:protein TonB